MLRNDSDRPIWMRVTGARCARRSAARGNGRHQRPSASCTGLVGEHAVRWDMSCRTSASSSPDLGSQPGGQLREVALLDLLPAGFEIKSVRNEETLKSFPPCSSPELYRNPIAEARDDRFFASFIMGNGP